MTTVTHDFTPTEDRSVLAGASTNWEGEYELTLKVGDISQGPEAYMRWLLDIEKGRTITSATLTLKSATVLASKSGTLRLNFRFLDPNLDNPDWEADDADFAGWFYENPQSSRAISNGNPGSETVFTINVTGSVQALVNRTHWGAGQHAICRIYLDGSTYGVGEVFPFYSSDSSSSPELSIEFEIRDTTDIGSGGAAAGGTALVGLNKSQPIMAAGVQAGGSALAFVSRDETATGGLEIEGVAIHHTEIAVGGGVTLSGSAHLMGVQEGAATVSGQSGGSCLGGKLIRVRVSPGSGLILGPYQPFAQSEMTVSAVYAELLNPTIEAAAVVTVHAEVLYAASATVTAMGEVSILSGEIVPIAATITGTSLASVRGGKVYSVVGSGGVLLAGATLPHRRIQISATVTIFGTAEVQAIGLYDQTSSLSGNATGVVIAMVIHRPSVTITSLSTVTVAAQLNAAVRVSAAVAASSGMQGFGGYLLDGAADVVGSASFVASLSKWQSVAITLEAHSTEQCLTSRTRNTSSVIPTFVTQNIVVQTTRNSSATLSVRAELAVNSTFLITAAASTNSNSALSVMAFRAAPAAAMILTSSDCSAIVARITPASATVVGLSEAESFASAIYAGSASVTSFVWFTAHARADFQTGATIIGQSGTTATSVYRPTPFPSTLYNWLEPQLSCPLFPLLLPRNVTLPAITYGRRSTEFLYYLDQPSSQRITVLGFDIFARSQAEAIDLSEELLTALHDYRGDIGNTLVYHSEAITLDDALFEDAGGNHQGVIRSVDFEIIHNHRRDVTETIWTTDQDLRTYLQEFTARQVTMVPDLSDSRPLITLTRSGTGLETYIGNARPFTDADYTIRIDSTSYATTLALADTLRRSLGNPVDDESDTFDFDAENRPLYRTELSLSFS
ncbi:hypothetical protein GC163_12570 [bacterium]|nr:hypothetical protein [bacterium]